ncbi:MAG: glycoside hydrolase family 2 [Eggerthellaceae bacterium]|nr:glycoside hydrolase family 2 [Eggerthellaceae bacterium]
MLDLKRVLAAAPKKPDGSPLRPLMTPWGEAILDAKRTNETEPTGDNEPIALHPHPQFERDSFHSLNGFWDYAIVDCENPAAAWLTAAPPTTWDGEIRVPFSPEAPLSGVNRQLQPSQLLWYRRCVPAPQLEERQLLILHFEAVDYACRCIVNGREVGTHTGGYLPMSFDITSESVMGAGQLDILLCVRDPSDAGVQLRGKQRLERGGIWYTAQSGIWQTAWWEVVPETYMRQARILPRADEGLLEIHVTTNVPARETLHVTLRSEGSVVAQGSAVAEERFPDQLLKERESSLAFCVTLAVPDPHLWSPDDPFLYQLELQLGSDIVHSYCAFRTVSVQPDGEGVPRLFLNHQPLFVEGVLDQGYWPDGLLTAPSDEALIFDIETMKAAGFNLLRKHIKVEQDRWYYHCDRLGMLVWQDMVSGGDPLSAWHSSYKPTLLRASWNAKRDNNPKAWAHLSAASEEYRAEWLASCVLTVRYLENHPSVVVWGLFNEAWGQFNSDAAVQAVRLIDPTRPIDATSGWYDQGGGDFLSVHNYFRPLQVYRDFAKPPRAFVLSEFGGISFPVPGHCALDTEYGYGSAADPEAFRTELDQVIRQAEALEAAGCTGFVYTQLSDVEEETNGLLTYDRRINKLDLP